MGANLDRTLLQRVLDAYRLRRVLSSTLPWCTLDSGIEFSSRDPNFFAAENLEEIPSKTTVGRELESIVILQLNELMAKMRERPHPVTSEFLAQGLPYSTGAALYISPDSPPMTEYYSRDWITEDYAAGDRRSYDWLIYRYCKPNEIDAPYVDIDRRLVASKLGEALALIRAHSSIIVPFWAFKTQSHKRRYRYWNNGSWGEWVEVLRGPANIGVDKNSYADESGAVYSGDVTASEDTELHLYMQDDDAWAAAPQITIGAYFNARAVNGYGAGAVELAHEEAFKVYSAAYQGTFMDEYGDLCHDWKLPAQITKTSMWFGSGGIFRDWNLDTIIYRPGTTNFKAQLLNTIARIDFNFKSNR